MTAKYSILYVDDEPQNLFAFQAVFRRFFDIVTAEGGREAIDILQKRKFDIIVSDQRMPSMTGIELCEYAMHNYPSSARLIVTGYSEIEALSQAIREGKIRDYVKKPWNVKEMKDIIEQTIKGNMN